MTLSTFPCLKQGVKLTLKSHTIICSKQIGGGLVHVYRYKQSARPKRSLSLSLSHTHTHTHTDSLSLSHTHTHTFTTIINKLYWTKIYIMCRVCVCVCVCVCARACVRACVPARTRVRLNQKLTMYVFAKEAKPLCDSEPLSQCR